MCTSTHLNLCFEKLDQSVYFKILCYVLAIVYMHAFSKAPL